MNTSNANVNGGRPVDPRLRLMERAPAPQVSSNDREPTRNPYGLPPPRLSTESVYTGSPPGYGHGGSGRDDDRTYGSYSYLSLHPHDGAGVIYPTRSTVTAPPAPAIDVDRISANVTDALGRKLTPVVQNACQQSGAAAKVANDTRDLVNAYDKRLAAFAKNALPKAEERRLDTIENLIKKRASRKDVEEATGVAVRTEIAQLTIATPDTLAPRVRAEVSLLVAPLEERLSRIGESIDAIRDELQFYGALSTLGFTMLEAAVQRLPVSTRKKIDRTPKLIDAARAAAAPYQRKAVQVADKSPTPVSPEYDPLFLPEGSPLTDLGGLEPVADLGPAAITEPGEIIENREDASGN